MNLEPRKPTFLSASPKLSLGATALAVVGAVALISGAPLVLSIPAMALGVLYLIWQPLRILLEDVPGTAPEETPEYVAMKRRVLKCQYLENTGGIGDRVADQFNQIVSRRKSFAKLLPEKFNPAELAFSRYESAALETAQAIFENLNSAALTLEQVDSIDPRMIKKKIAVLSQKASDPNCEKELLSLNERSMQRETQISRVMEILDLNEKAITEFDRMSMAVSEIQPSTSNSANLEQNLEQLKALAARAKKYAQTSGS